MKKSVKRSVKRSGSPNGKLAPAGVLTPDPTVGDLEKTFRHGMCLRSRSGSVSPKRSALKKKASALPVIIRPEYSSRLGVQERLTLRPRYKLSPRMTRSRTKQSQPGDVGRRNPKEKKSPTEPRTRSAVSRRTVKKKKSAQRGEEKEKEMVRYFKFSSTEEEMGRYLEFNLSRMVSAAGFTERERSLCSEYLIKRDYEFLETIPEEFKYELEFIEEIREGKGYGLLMHPPPRYIGKNFNWYFDEWKNNAEVKEYVSKMIKMVLDDMEIRFQDPEQKLKVRYRYDPKYGIDNLVRSQLGSPSLIRCS